MDTLKLPITTHAIFNFKNQTNDPNQKLWDDEKIKQFILKHIWAKGEIQKVDFATKFKKYGLKELNTEHRRWEGWVATCVDGVIITVHKRTQTEKRKEKRRKKIL